MIDKKHVYWEYLKKVADKSVNVANTLGRLMANIEGPKCSKWQHVLMAVTQSAKQYGALMIAWIERGTFCSHGSPGISTERANLARLSMKTPKEESESKNVTYLSTYNDYHKVMDLHQFCLIWPPNKIEKLDMDIQAESYL